MRIALSAPSAARPTPEQFQAVEKLRKSDGPLTRGLVALLACLAVACGSEPKAVQGPGDKTDSTVNTPDIEFDSATDTPDIAVQPDATTSTTADVDSDVPPDAEPADAGAKCPSKAGCPCSSVDQCDSNFCIETPKGQQCAATCLEGCPNATFKCVTVSSPGGGDEVNICVPKYGKVCNPCNANADCQGPGNGDARCVDQGNAGAFCGGGCASNDDCPGDYECKNSKDVAGQTTKQCVVKDGGACTCSDSAMKLQLSTKCYNVAGESKCEGKRTCKLAGSAGAPEGGGLTSCVAADPAPEICDGKDNDCDAQTDEATCDDKNPCTDDVCAGAEGCKPANNTAKCDADSSVCTQNDACLNGACVAGKTIECEDKNVCTTDSCDPKDGCKFTNAEGVTCDADDTLCTVSDSCKGGECVPGKKKACASDDPCVEGKCEIGTGKCLYPTKVGQPCNDGNPCTSGDKCGGPDGNQCLGSGDTPCDDKNACTADSCDATGCVHSAVTTVCDDGNACTSGDACVNGVCAGPKTQSCDDVNPCTNDGCDPVKGCSHVGTSGNPCDDGNSCTSGDQCKSGQCESGPNGCQCNNDGECAKAEDGNYCNGTLYCDKSAVPFQCKVNPLSLVACDLTVNNACQTNGCDPASGKCVLNKKADTTPCNADSNACTSGDACFGGQCLAGAPSKCSDSNGCTDDSCDPLKGCVYVPNKSVCDADASACTQGDACVNGSCIPGKQVVCNDNEACTKDSCDIATGQCTNAPLSQSCSDSNVCTTGDACGTDAVSGKYTCVAGKTSACDDSNPCTTDLCDPTKGCSNVVDATQKAPCYDGDPKTKDKGQCKSGVATCGSDGKPGACVGQVLPAGSDPCDGVDNNCDGIVDAGCAPNDFTAHFSNASVSGSGPKYAARSVTGVSSLSGTLNNGGKYSVTPGYLVWLKALLGL